MDGLKGKRELKEKRKKVQEANVKRKEDLQVEKEDNKNKDQKKKKILEGDEDEQAKSKNLFTNFQKEGKLVPNIASHAKRAPGISKGMWKKELKRQLTGTVEKRRRTGDRK